MEISPLDSGPAAFFPIDHDRLASGKTCLLMLAAAYTIPHDIKGIFNKRIYYRPEGDCVFNVAVHHGDSQLDEYNLDRCPTILSELTPAEGGEAQLAYVVTAEHYLGIKRKVASLLRSMGEEGWDTERALEELAKDPDKQFVFAYPDYLLEFAQEIDASGPWDTAQVYFHSYIDRR